MLKHFCIFFLLTAALTVKTGEARAQNQPYVKIESPNAATFDKFSNIPVDLFTGTPEISIPLHTVSYGKINVPVTLRYHPSAVKVANHPSWVGTGWDLEAGGSITRLQRGGIDEYYTGNNDGGMIDVNSYYPWPGNTYAGGCGAQQADATDWNTPAKLIYYFTSQNASGLGTDVQADEFSFSFMGHSGKFYYTNEGWQVVSDENIQVQLNPAPNDFFSPTDVDNLMYQQYGTKISSNFNNTIYQGRTFKSFTLTTPDGTSYVFGGPNATEFTCPAEPDAGGNPDFIASTWMLTKIVDPEQNEVDLTYAATYPVVDLSIGLVSSIFGCHLVSGNGSFGPSDGALSGQQGNVNSGAYSGFFLLPVYLTKISSPNENVIFNASVATCLRFQDLQFTSLGGTAASQYFLTFLNTDLTHLQWEKLDNITIMNNRSRQYKKFQFGYNNVSTQRLALNTLTGQDNQGGTISAYQFGYNNIAGLPLYDGNHADHWGFFNNKDLSGVEVHNAYTYRETDPTLVTTGLLSTITYPTGGHSILSWEAHDYSQYVSTDRTQLLAQSTNATGEVYMGGSRIRDISSYMPDGTLAYEKTYLYKRGYKSQVTNTSTLTSSGILNGLPQYVFDFQDRLGIDGDASFSVHMAYMNPYASYSYNGQDSYIGYDEVAELERDGSYTRHFFTSYGTDFNGVSHFDQAPAAVIGWVLSTDKYAPHTDLERERGKLVASLQYSPASSGDVLLKKTVNTYRSDAGRTSQFIKRLENSSSNSYTNAACASDALVLATANKMYTYMYYPVTQTVTNYDQNGSNPVTETTNFTYNANNLVLTKALTNSKNEVVTHAMQYTTEATDATSIQMAATPLPHMLNYLIQETVTKTPPGQSALLQQINKTLYYSPATGLYEKQYVYQQNGSNALETRKQFYQYDAHGNVLEESKTTDVHDVYLWSYNSQYPVAKITGSTYSAVSALLTQAQIDAASVNDASMRSLFITLRSQLPGVFITSYTYSPVYGMTSQTDPQGRNTYYDYDGFGRLVAVRDQDNNIIKRMCYNYAGQPEACGLYYNGPQSGTYTTVCNPGYLGGAVTYTVPAQTYTGSTLAAANQVAEADVVANGQNYANATGTCRPYWNNQNEVDVNYTKNTCGPNMTGQTLTYRVLVGSETSFVSQADANQLAVNDANDVGSTKGQDYANQNGTCTCNYTTIVLTINPGASATGYRAILIDSHGVNTTWNFPTSGSTTVTTAFPSGTYTIGFAPTGGPGTNHTFTYAMGPNTGTVQNSTSASFPNVAVSCNLTMTIY